MTDSKQLKLFIGTPSYGEKVCSRQIQMYIELGHALASFEERFVLVGTLDVDSQPIDRVRNIILSAAKQAGADWLLMIDADVWSVGDPDPFKDNAGVQILRMISEADRACAVVVGANVYRRGGEGVMTYRESPTTGRMLPVNPPGLEPVDAIGTSLIAINILRLPDQAEFRFADGLSEDLYFCKQVREFTKLKLNGNAIFVDGRVRTGHMKRPEPIFNFSDALNQYYQDRAKTKT